VVFDRRLPLVLPVFIWLFSISLQGLTVAAEKPGAKDEPKFVPGEEVRIDTDNERIGNDHFIVYVPTDYTQEKSWPVIFCYHGTGGKPTTWPMRQATRGEGFIVIGMGYFPPPKGKITRGQYSKYVKSERRSVLEVKRYVREHLNIDEKRLSVSGFSRGGWHTARLLESGPKVWAGAVIFAAGRSRNVNAVTTAANKSALRGKPIYIGAGENDVNLKSAKKAAAYYRQLGAEVTFEEFEGLGHGFDPTGSQILYNWLVANGSAQETKSPEASEKHHRKPESKEQKGED
jgi:predicted esterase